MFFFFNDTAATEIYSLSLHDALPICGIRRNVVRIRLDDARRRTHLEDRERYRGRSRSARSYLYERNDHLSRHRSEEHTSELQSRQYLVCSLLLEKKEGNGMESVSWAR